MAASITEIQELADQILERLETRIRSGQMVVHYLPYRGSGARTPR